MLPILLYHHIGEVPRYSDGYRLYVSPERFEHQMAYLSRAGYQCLSLEDVVRRWQHGVAQPRKSFVLTFDDGFRDVYTVAWPIMRRYGFTATVFFVTERAGSHPDWGTQVQSSGAQLLSWSEARDLVAAGFTFGSHTLTHPRLTSLGGELALRELRQSKVDMEENLQLVVNLFAYPFGASNDCIQHMVADTGYIAACGTDRAAWGLYNLWRTECFDTDHGLRFAGKAHGLYNHFIRLREYLCLDTPRRRFIYRTGKAVQKMVGPSHTAIDERRE